jgi:1-phosphatidylinositol-4-phosphate 5-kinase
LQERQTIVRRGYKRYFFLLFAIFCFIGIAPLADRQSQHLLVVGSVFSVLSCSAVIYSYVTYPNLQRHPSPLIFYRSIADMLLGIRLLVGWTYMRKYNFDDEEGLSICQVTAGLTQFLMLSSESWFAIISLDLLHSLTNPFTSYRANLRRYHLFAWGSGLLTCLVLVFSKEAWGVTRAAFGDVGIFSFCWIKDEGLLENGIDYAFLVWGLLFFVWLVLYYAFAVGMTLYGKIRLRQGIRETFETRYYNKLLQLIV